MERDEELGIVKRSLELEKNVDRLYDEYSRVCNISFAKKPDPPQKQNVVKAPYPQVEEKTKTYLMIWLIGALIVAAFSLADASSLIFGMVVGFPAWFVGWPVLWYAVINKARVQRIVNSQEYQYACWMIDYQYQESLRIAEVQYAEQMNYYNSVVMVDYNRNKAQWDAEHNKNVEDAERKYEEAKGLLDEYYEVTRLIPQKYHNVNALEYIFTVLNTSQYSLREAIDDYERMEQRRIEMSRLREQRAANDLAYQQAQLTAQQNDLLDEQNFIAERTRRDQNLANAVSAIQRHNTNKALNRIADNYNKK